MVTSAVAQETVCALRRKIAKIEGTLADRLDAPAVQEDGDFITRQKGMPKMQSLPREASRFDIALEAFPRAGLIELVGGATNDSGAVAGFALALACMLYGAIGRPLVWIGTADIFREAGRPYAPGLLQRFGIDPRHLILAETTKISDMLWVAEEAASLSALAAVLVEIRGNPGKLDLTATRRLHRRALAAGYPLMLLRQAGMAEPTAAPLRLDVAPAPAVPRATMFGVLEGSIGPPAFHLTISKSRTAMSAAFTLEWNNDACTFHERAAKDPVAVVSTAADRTRDEAALRKVMAYPASGRNTASGLQPARKQHPANRNARYAG